MKCCPCWEDKKGWWEEQKKVNLLESRPEVSAWAGSCHFKGLQGMWLWSLGERVSLILLPYKLDWPKSSFGVFCHILWKIPNKHFGQPITCVCASRSFMSNSATL